MMEGENVEGSRFCGRYVLSVGRRRWPSYGGQMGGSLSRRGLSDLSRRDQRTQPGVLTPGNRSKKGPPQRGGRGLSGVHVLINEARTGSLTPLLHLQPRGRWVQFGLGAVLPHFSIPTPLFEQEDDHEHDFDAPGEGGSSFGHLPGVKTPGSVLKSPPPSPSWLWRTGGTGSADGKAT
jgi:hypothetical protein